MRYRIPILLLVVTVLGVAVVSRVCFAGADKATNETKASAASSYSIPWMSINSGGNNPQSATCQAFFTVGQPVTGEGTRNPCACGPYPIGCPPYS